MIRLTLVTLAGLFAILSFMGEPGARPTVTPALAEVPPAPEPVQAPAPEAVVTVAAQTPEQVVRFAGPPLRPSPEFARAAEAAEVAGAAPADVAGGRATLYVTGTSKVNMRAGPSRNEAVVAALPGGTAVQAVGPTTGAWVEVRDADGRVGFMSAGFLSPNRPG